ncbi:MAG: glycosyltransferase family 2 protein [Nitrososphaerales archaeon]|nr:glycosyltransferase family 2 protein [Nitrososphaerales archaeon]
MRVACIPAYNEERTIAKVVIAAQRQVDQVIVCDDGSSDMTGTIAGRLGARVIRHERNMGKGEALRSLFLASREAVADVMVTIDGDGQHDPDEIPQLLDALGREKADVVIGSRFIENSGGVPTHRRFGNRVLNAFTVPGISDTQSGFRAYNKRAIETLLPAEMGMGVDSEILMDAMARGLRVVEIPASVKYGIGKTSTHNPVFHTLDVMMSAVKLTSIRHPLIFYGLPGLALIVAGLFYAYHAIVLFSTQQAITNITMTYELIGFALTLVGLLAFFTGIMLFTMSTLVRKGE